MNELLSLHIIVTCIRLYFSDAIGILLFKYIYNNKLYEGK